MPDRLVCFSHSRRQTNWSVGAILDTRKTGLFEPWTTVFMSFKVPHRLVCLSLEAKQTSMFESKQISLSDPF